MDLVTNYIYKQVANKQLPKNEAKQMLLQLTEKKREDIAIIGIAGKYPKSENMEAFWNNLKDGVNCVDYPSKERREIWKEFYPSRFKSDKDKKEIFNIRGYMEEIDKFDADFFGISPKEAKFMDPVQRIFLQTAYEAIEDSGQEIKGLAGSKTGIFVGLDNQNGHEYAKISDTNDSMAMTGLYPALLANRLAYYLDLKGQCLTIDTACSSGLVAIYEAIKALKEEECHIAVAGGIYIRSDLYRNEDDPMKMILTEQGVVQTFDNNAGGTVAAEGAGVVILKKLSEARKDGDHIYGVLIGGAVNNDGSSSTITAPNVDAQTDVLIQAWENAGIEPETISYIEAHGTGTILGDPIEIRALNNAFREYTNKKQFCGIGSVKSSIGHTASSAGLAAVIKMVLALNNRILPPTLHFETPNRYIDFTRGAVYINDRAKPWKEDRKRRCGVSSFGFSGTNCHLVLEEAPEPELKTKTKEDSVHIFTVSARTEKGWKEFINRYCDFMDRTESVNLEQFCYTANARRRGFGYRTAVVFRHLSELKGILKQLRKYGFDLQQDGVWYGNHKIVSDKKSDRKSTEKTLVQIKVLNSEVQSLLSASDDLSPQDLRKLAELYVEGADINWEAVYKTPSVMSIPSYPLERKSCWQDANIMESLSAPMNQSGEVRVWMPHITRLAAESLHTDIYTLYFSDEDHWAVGEHRVMNQFIVPGTVFIDLYYKIGRFYNGDKYKVSMQELIFKTPLIIEEENPLDIQLVVVKSKTNKELQVEIISRQKNDSNAEWVIHSDCRILLQTESKDFGHDICDIESIKERCTKEAKQYEGLKKESGKLSVSLGNRWKTTIREFFIGGREMLVHVALPEEYKEDRKDYDIHPSLMDNAVNAMITSIGQGIYLPVAYESLTIYGTLPEDYYSHIIWSDKYTFGDEAVVLNLKLVDGGGRVLAEAEGYTVKKVKEAAFFERKQKQMFYEALWSEDEEDTRISNLSSEEERERILIFTDRHSLHHPLTEQLMEAGKHTVLVNLSDEYYWSEDACTIRNSSHDYRKLFQELGHGPLKIIYLIGLIPDIWESNWDKADRINHEILYRIYSLKRILDAIEANNWRQKVSIRFLSYNTYSITSHEDRRNPVDACLFALGKVINYEYAGITCYGVDTDYVTEDAVILEELLSHSSLKNIAFRDNVRFCEQLSERKASEQSKSPELKGDGVYIITGGLGGLAGELVKNFIQRKSLNIALIGRRDIENRAEAPWVDLSHNYSEQNLYNSSISYHRADICCEPELKRVLEMLRQKFGKINGIIHTAGIKGKGFLRELTIGDFEEVLKPKTEGAILLDQLTERDDLDFFLLFSSATTLFGGHGNGDYVCANAFLDEYAGRSRYGNFIQVINWTGWKEAGMFALSGSREDSVFMSIETKQAIDAMWQAIGQGWERVIIGELNEDKLLGISETDMPVKLPKAFGFKRRDKDKGSKAVELHGRLEGSYSEVEKNIANVFSKVLNLDVIDIYDSFYQLGGDSISAAELMKEIDKQYPGFIGISDIFTYSSVMEISEFIETTRRAQEISSEHGNREIKDMFKDLEKGTISIENGLKLLDEMMGRK